MTSSTGEVLNHGFATWPPQPSASRARVLDFSSPYVDADQHMISRRDSGPATLRALAGKRVGVKAETTSNASLRDVARESTEVVTFEDLAAVKKSLVDGRSKQSSSTAPSRRAS